MNRIRTLGLSISGLADSRFPGVRDLLALLILRILLSSANVGPSSPQNRKS